MTRLSMTGGVGAFADFRMSSGAASRVFTRKPRVIPNPWSPVRRDAWLAKTKGGKASRVGAQHAAPLPIAIPPPFPQAHSRSRRPWPTYRLPGGKARRARPRDSDRRHQAARSRSSFPFRLRPTGRRFLWRSPAADGQRRGLPPDILRRLSAFRDRG